MPLGGLIVGAAAPIVGGLIKGAAGVGKDTTATTDYQNTSQYDPTDHMYGGYANGLRDNNADLHLQEGIVDNRGSNTANFSAAQPNYGQAQGWNDQAGYQRAAQENIAQNLMYARATGAIPTVAEQQGAVDMRRAQAAQAAQAASARGAAGVALAGQQAANNTANAQGQIASQTQVNAANERAGYTQQAQNAFSNIRNQDMQTADQFSQRAQNDAALRTGQQQFNAQMEQANRDSNDQRAMGYEQMRQNANQTQLQANLVNQGQLAGSFNQQQGIHSQRGAENAAYENANWDAIGKGMQNMGGGGSPIPAKAKGGPVAPGRPYLVGERGPELIVPQQAGTVIPNHQLRQVAPGLARGGAAAGRNGLQGMGARDTASMLDDRAFQNERGVPTAGLDGAIAAQAERDRQDAALPPARMSQSAWEAQLTGAPKEYNPRDPAVGLERIAQERSSPRKGGPTPGNDNAEADAKRGVAPGTTDFESTEPKAKVGAPGALELLRKGGAGFFGGYREDGGPVAPGKAYVAGEKGPEAVIPGMTERGNIDLHKRPVVKNADGSISTVRSIGVNIDGKEVLLPTVSPDGKILSDDAAVDLYRRTGQHLGKFATPEASTAYAQRLHEDQAAEYEPKPVPQEARDLEATARDHAATGAAARSEMERNLLMSLISPGHMLPAYAASVLTIGHERRAQNDADAAEQLRLDAARRAPRTAEVQAAKGYVGPPIGDPAPNPTTPAAAAPAAPQTTAGKLAAWWDQMVASGQDSAAALARGGR